MLIKWKAIELSPAAATTAASTQTPTIYIYQTKPTHIRLVHFIFFFFFFVHRNRVSVVSFNRSLCFDNFNSIHSTSDNGNVFCEQEPIDPMCYCWGHVNVIRDRVRSVWLMNGRTEKNCRSRNGEWDRDEFHSQAVIGYFRVQPKWWERNWEKAKLRCDENIVQGGDALYFRCSSAAGKPNEWFAIFKQFIMSPTSCICDPRHWELFRIP